MIKNLSRLAALFIGAIPLTAAAQDQTQNIYEWFDSVAGKKNAAIHNGPIYFNLFKTQGPEIHPFLDQDVYQNGEVYFDGQPYYDVDLKYDINKDLLILQPFEPGYYKLIVLIAPKTTEFYLGKRHFVNLDFVADAPDFIVGYHEELLAGKGLTLYTKYHKTSHDVIRNEAQVTEFKLRQEYYLLNQGKFNRVGSKGDVTKIFPTQKKLITDFYSENKRRYDEPTFMRLLFEKIDTVQN